MARDYRERAREYIRKLLVHDFEYNPLFGRALGDTKAGVLLAYLYHWAVVRRRVHKEQKDDSQEWWIWVNLPILLVATGLTLHELRRARAILQGEEPNRAGQTFSLIREEHQGREKIIWVFVEVDVVEELLRETLEREIESLSNQSIYPRLTPIWPGEGYFEDVRQRKESGENVMRKTQNIDGGLFGGFGITRESESDSHVLPDPTRKRVGNRLSSESLNDSHSPTNESRTLDSGIAPKESSTSSSAQSGPTMVLTAVGLHDDDDVAVYAIAESPEPEPTFEELCERIRKTAPTLSPALVKQAAAAGAQAVSRAEAMLPFREIKKNRDWVFYESITQPEKWGAPAGYLSHKRKQQHVGLAQAARATADQQRAQQAASQAARDVELEAYKRTLTADDLRELQELAIERAKEHSEFYRSRIAMGKAGPLVQRHIEECFRQILAERMSRT